MPPLVCVFSVFGIFLVWSGQQGVVRLFLDLWIRCAAGAGTGLLHSYTGGFCVLFVIGMDAELRMQYTFGRRL